MRYLLAFLFSLALASSISAQNNPAPIAVVRSWEELQKQPPIDLGGGVTIRLGLEADKLPQWSGGLLYCLAEGYTPPMSGQSKLPFGPVHAVFSFEKGEGYVGEIGWTTSEKWPKGTYLYVHALPIDRVGNYQVRVIDHDGEVLARASVLATSDFFHPWMPWLEGIDSPKTPWEGIALPNVRRLYPTATIPPGKPKMGSLPTLLPTKETPKLSLSLEGNEFIIRAESDFTTSRPDYHFLARWWVNDKPYVPKQGKKLEALGYGLVLADKELRLKVEFLPDRLGAKPGDKIGLQLLHSECEWSWCSGTSLGGGGRASRPQGENLRISNRIDFVVPKK